jgi:pyrroline-5-carboxylate reductase
MTYGIVGVGAIAASIVTGLSEAVEHPPTILLSPRNAEVSARLASLYPNVRISPDNQAVVDAASTVILSLRPQDAPTVLPTLRFSAGQAIVSVMAATSIEALAPLVAPATAIGRAIPLPSVAQRQCLTPILPPGGEARMLFERLGGVIELEDARVFDAIAASTATVAAHFAYLGAVSAWLAAHGVPSGKADNYVAGIFAGLTPALRSGEGFDHLARDHATRGGLNEMFLDHLTGDGLLRSVERGLDRVLRRVSGSELEVRPVAASDAPELTGLLNALIARGGTTALQEPFTPQRLAETYLTGPEVVSCVVAVEADGRLAGFQTLIRVGHLPQGWGDIGTFARVGASQKGVGGALFAATRERAAAGGLTALNATIRADNTGGLAYYARMGFEDYAVDRAVPLRDGSPVDRIHRRYTLG